MDSEYLIQAGFRYLIFFESYEIPIVLKFFVNNQQVESIHLRLLEEMMS